MALSANRKPSIWIGWIGLTDENDLMFLGYPDNGLLDLWYQNYGRLSLDQYLTTVNNGLSETYGNQGLGGSDYHFSKFSPTPSTTARMCSRT